MMRAPRLRSRGAPVSKSTNTVAQVDPPQPGAVASNAAPAHPDPAAQLLFRAATLAILLAALALRLLCLDGQDIWWDEARNITVALKALEEIATAGELDIHPPLYFYALHLWTALLGATAFSARLLSVWFGVLAVALAGALAQPLFVQRSRGQLAGLLAMLLAAVSPFALAEAQETRMYTMTWALLSAAALALWQATGSRSRPVWWALFAVLAAATLATHYGAAIVLATWAAWLLGWALAGPQRGRRLATLVATGALTLLLLAPLAPVMLRQIPGYDNPNLDLPALGSYAGELARAFTQGEFAPAWNWTLGRWLWLALLAGGAIAGFLAHRQGATRSRGDRIALLTLWLLGGVALYYLILVRRSAFDPRYISFVLPPLWALAGWALASLRSVARPLPWLAAGALALLAVPSLRADLTDPANFREDMRGAVAWLAARSTPNDIILVDQRYPFGFYWQRWNNDGYGFPPAEPANLAPAQYLFVDVNRLDQRLTELAGDAQNVFWVTWYESDTDPRGATAALLNAYGELVDTQELRGYTVSQWRMQPPVVFRLPSDFTPLDRRFESGITLTEGDWLGRQTSTPAGQPVLVTLRWQADGPTARPLKASLRLRDAAGAVVSQADHVLLNDRHLRTDAWPAGASALGIYNLALDDAPPGDYTLTVVLYDEETLAPVGLADGSGVEPVIGTVRVGQ